MRRILYHYLEREKALLTLAAIALVAVVATETGRRPMTWHHPRSSGAAARRPPAIPVPAYFARWSEAYVEANRGQDPLGLVRGIFLGEDSEIPARERDLFRAAGLSHLLAASGFNCWIVAAVFNLAALVLLHLGAGALPSLFALRLKERITPLARLSGAWLFWLWTDQSPPITRSAVMISAKFLLDAAGLAAGFPRLLLAQYLVSLAVCPSLWHSASFQLTFGCLFGLILFPAAVERFRPAGGGWIDAGWDYIVTSLGAVLGTIPTTWAVFGEINFMSLTTNWFAVPAVSVLLMPLGLVQILLLAPGLGIATTALGAKTIFALAWLGGKIVLGLDLALRAWLSVVPSLRYRA